MKNAHYLQSGANGSTLSGWHKQTLVSLGNTGPGKL